MSARLRSPQGRVGLLLHLLALAPALLLLRAVYRNAVSVPFMDDWQFVPLIEQVRAGHIPWADLAAPHDEHRLLIPRILIIASTILSHGNYRVQCFLTFGCVLVLSLALLFLLRRSLGAGRATPLVWLLLNVVLFSPIQWHNWLWPMQFCYFLPFTFLGLALAACYADLRPAGRFATCMACAWAASFSFVQGLLLWPVLPVVLLRDGLLGSARARRRYGAVWVAAGALALFLYFHGLFHNTADPSYAYLHQGVPPTASTLRMLHDHPLDTLARMGTFAVAMYGNAISRGFPVASNLRLSIQCGCVLILAFAALWIGLALRRRLEGAALAWVALGLHAFLTAGLVAVGRVWAGPGQPLTPRYATFGTFCLLSVVALACLWFHHEVASPAARERFYLACGALLVLLGVNWAYGLNLMGEWRDVQTTSRAAVHFSQLLRVPSLHLAGGRPEFLVKRIAILQRLHYWKPPLATTLRLDQFRISTELPERAGHVWGQRLRPDGVWVVRGRAHFGQGGHIPDAILVTSPDASGVPTIRALCEPRSPPRFERHAHMRDLEFVDRGPRAIYGKFVCRIGPAAIPPGEPRKAELWALDFDQWAVHRVPGELSLDAAAGASVAGAAS